MSEYLSTGNLPDDYAQLAATVRDFAQTVVAPVAAKHDAERSFPYAVIAGMAEMGLFGLPFPEAGEDYAFEFTGGAAHSAFGRHAKRSGGFRANRSVYRQPVLSLKPNHRVIGRLPEHPVHRAAEVPVLLQLLLHLPHLRSRPSP